MTLFHNKSRRLAHAVSGLALLSVLAVPASTQTQQQVLPPIARYTIDAGTMSGMAAMGSGMGAAMSMMGGGAPRPIHELVLRIGSTRTPTGAAKADHFMPTGARLGKSVPLDYQPGKGAPDGPQGQLPKGRLLIYWGCGATAAKGQPIVIDFAKVAKGQIPPGLYQQPVNLPGDWDIKPSNSTTYGEWPNAKNNGKQVSSESSLIGAHRIASSYAPEIAFTLNNDFMPALNARSTEQGDGSIMLSWNSLPTATGYYAWAFSAKNMDRGGQPTDMVWWASSATRAFGGPLWDWLSPAAVQKLIGLKTVMPPSQKSCQIPAEVKRAGGEVTMGSLYAYGPEVHFANPPRPADPKIAWKPDWTTRVRFRSNTMFMIGMPDMGGGMSEAEDSGSDDGGQQGSGKPKCRGLTAAMKRAAGLCE